MGVKRLQSAENTLRVLEAIAEEQPVGVSELARHLGLDKNAVQRILVTLEHTGWARRAVAPPVRWELTSKAFVVGRRFASDLRDRARPLLEDLQATTGETALLWSVRGDRVAVLDAVESHDPLRATVPVGFETELAVAPEFLAYVHHGDDAPPPEPWYVIDTSFTNVRCVGSPIYGVDGEVAGAVMVLGPMARLDRSAPDRIGPLVMGAARALSDGPADGGGPPISQ